MYKSLIATDHEGNANASIVSLDADLDTLVINLKQKAQVLKEEIETASLTATITMVAETIQQQKAIMLPEVAACFRSVVTARGSMTTRTARWLLR